MANTPNYNLKKVEYTEIADIPSHFNANFDTIDTVMKNNADAATAAEVNAKSYASGLIGTLSNLLTTAKNNIVAAVNEIFGKVEDVEDSLATHLADYASMQFGERPYTSTENKTYYIDQANGSDENDGESSATAFKTWAKALSVIPVFIKHIIYIRIIGNLQEDIVLENISCLHGGIFELRGDTSTIENHQINSLRIVNCRGIGWLRHLYVNGQVRVENSSVQLTQFKIRNADGVGLHAINNSTVMLFYVDFDENINRDCIQAGNGTEYCGGWVQTRYVTGKGTRYGLYALGGIITKGEGSTLTGGTANEYTAFGGVIR